MKAKFKNIGCGLKIRLIGRILKSLFQKGSGGGFSSGTNNFFSSSLFLKFCLTGVHKKYIFSSVINSKRIWKWVAEN
jgi:hypothetical protein